MRPFFTILFTLLFATCFSQLTKPLAVLQGINMPIKSGAGTTWSAYYLQDAKGYIAQNITFPSTGGTTYRIDVSGYSSEYENNTWANMQIKIDGVLKKEITVTSTSVKIYSFLISGISAGSHQVQIASTKRIGPSTAGRLFIGLVYVTQTTLPMPYVYPDIAKQTLKPGQTLTSLHFGSQVLRGFSLGGAYLTANDMKDMKSTGANIARYFIKVDRITGTNTYQFRAGEKAKSDSLVARASRLGVYVIPTFQIYPEGVNEDFWGKDATGSSRRANIINLWKELATRYKDKPYIAAYDPINEPRNNRQYADWIHYLSKIIEGIRSIDPTRCILVEHSYSIEMFGMALPLPYSNLVYSPHGYPPLRITHQGVTATGGTQYERVAYPVTVATATQDVFTKTELTAALGSIRKFAHAYNVPVFVGEFSCASWALNGSSTKWIEDNISIIEAEKWAWGYHSFREAPAWDPEIPYTLFKTCSFNSNGTPVISNSTYRASRTMSAPTMVMLKKYFALNTSSPTSLVSTTPAVKITSPVVNASYKAPASVLLSAIVTSVDGTVLEDAAISKVEFYNGTTLLTTEYHAPYSWTWNNVAAGIYKITAKATDNNGRIITSAIVSFTVSSQTLALATATQSNSPSVESISNANRPNTVPAEQQELTAGYDFRLTPNPAVNNIQLNLNKIPASQGATILIQTISGSIVKQIAITPGRNVIPIDISSLSTGTYLIRFSGKGFSISKQFLKVR